MQEGGERVAKQRRRAFSHSLCVWHGTAHNTALVVRRAPRLRDLGRVEHSSSVDWKLV